MKKIFLAVVMVALVFGACYKAEISERQDPDGAAAGGVSGEAAVYAAVYCNPSFIRWFEFNKTYNVLISNRSRFTVSGYLMAAAVERDGTLIHESKVRWLSLRPFQRVRDIVYIRQYILEPPIKIKIPGAKPRPKMGCRVFFAIDGEAVK